MTQEEEVASIVLFLLFLLLLHLLPCLHGCVVKIMMILVLVAHYSNDEGIIMKNVLKESEKYGSMDGLHI